MVTGIMKATFYISIASIVIIVILKEGYHGGRGGFFVLNKNYEITQVLLTASDRRQVNNSPHLWNVCFVTMNQYWTCHLPRCTAAAVPSTAAWMSPCSVFRMVWGATCPRTCNAASYPASLHAGGAWSCAARRRRRPLCHVAVPAACVYLLEP